jgi:L-ribulokinase
MRGSKMFYRGLLNNLLKDSSIIDAATANALQKEVSDKIIKELSAAASKLPLDEKDELAVDWLNGRRTPDANQLLKASISGLSLGTDAPRIFKALVEATCFGAKAIVERFNNEGVPVKRINWLRWCGKKISVYNADDGRCNEYAIPYSQIRTNIAQPGSHVSPQLLQGIYSKVEDAMAAMGQGV